MNQIIIIYPSFSERLDIELVEAWKPWAPVHNGLMLLIPRFWTHHQIQKVYAETIPGNRWALVNHFNEKVCFRILKHIVSQYKQIRVLWIRDPAYYRLHNNATFDFLVLDCIPKIAADSSKQFLYKKYLADGWIFVYTFTHTNATEVFKHVDEATIIKHLKNLYESGISDAPLNQHNFSDVTNSSSSKKRH